LAAPNVLLGIASALAVVSIWSGFLVFSRAGVVTSLTAFDITGLRFAVAGALVLPFIRSWWPRHLPLRAQLIIALSGPGAVYSVLMTLGLSESSAAYGGVFANGSLPIFTMMLGALAGQHPNRNQLLATAIIISGSLLLSYRGMATDGLNAIAGIGLFLFASLLLSIYIISLRRWMLTPRQALALVNLPNALIFLPVWLLLLPSGLAETPLSSTLFQALFQGIGPGFLAVIFFALATMHLGPTATAGFSAVVPATAALLAIPVLYEIPTGMEWVGIVTVTAGLALLIIRR
jgi:drug/metabolite transporter (DMT)-like permease